MENRITEGFLVKELFTDRKDQVKIKESFDVLEGYNTELEIVFTSLFQRNEGEYLINAEFTYFSKENKHVHSLSVKRKFTVSKNIDFFEACGDEYIVDLEGLLFGKYADRRNLKKATVFNDQRLRRLKKLIAKEKDIN